MHKLLFCWMRMQSFLYLNVNYWSPWDVCTFDSLGLVIFHLISEKMYYNVVFIVQNYKYFVFLKENAAITLVICYLNGLDIFFL